MAIGSEIRAELLKRLEESGKDRKGARLMVKVLLLSYLGSVPDALWWVERRGTNPYQMVEEVVDAALLTASPDEFGLLLEHPDPKFREKVISSLGKNRTPREQPGNAEEPVP